MKLSGELVPIAQKRSDFPMKLGVLTNVIGETPLPEALAYFKSLGAQMVEIGCGGYPGKDHCDPGV